MKIKNSVDLSQIKDANEYIRHSSIAIKNVADAVNGGLEFDKNLNTQTVTVTFQTANSDTAVSHNLGRVVSGYLKSSQDAACDVYNGTTPSTDKIIYLKCTVATTVTLILH